MYRKKFMKFDRVFFKICEWTDRKITKITVADSRLESRLKQVT